DGRLVKLFGFRVFAYDHDLGVRFGEKYGGDAIGGGEHAVLRRHAGKDFESLFGFVLQASIVGVRVQAEQRDGRGRISGGSGGILEWFSASRKRADVVFVLGVEKSAGGRVVKLSDHCGGDFLRELKVGEIGGALIGLDARI